VSLLCWLSLLLATAELNPLAERRRGDRSWSACCGRRSALRSRSPARRRLRANPPSRRAFRSRRPP